jgi:hypothetical protein
MIHSLSFLTLGDWSHIGRILLVVIPILTAAISSLIAFAQYRINRDNDRRLALFERRKAIYDRTMEMIASVMQRANPSLDECLKLLRDTRDHELLFGPEVGAFIDEIYKRALALEAQNAMGHHDVEKRIETMNWFADQMREARKVFLKYLDLRKP